MTPHGPRATRGTRSTRRTGTPGRIGPVARAVRGGSRHRMQSAVIGLVVLVSTVASVLALGLLAGSNAPFDHAFATQRGAQLAMTIDSGKVTPAQLAATRHLPGVTAASGPFPEATVAPEVTGSGGTAVHLPLVTLAGRGSPGGAVDQVTLDAGHWVRGPGEIVVARGLPGATLHLGQRITVAGAARTGRLTVVGIATSVTGTADGWVEPSQLASLRATGVLPTVQMLYRFVTAASAADIKTDAAKVGRALPAGAVAGTLSYLTVRAQATSSIAVFVPFLVVFACLGLVLAVLIVANVVSGAVVAGFRRIGILRSIGFTPGQVAAAYLGQVAVPAVTGCLAGVLLGDLLAIPVLARTATVYGVGKLTVPAWVDLAVPAAMCAVVAAAALLPSLRAAQLSAVQAISAGRAPRQGRGYGAHRLLARLRVPRPVTIGLAAPFARPARTAMTVAAVLFGATAVTFAAGLSSSLNLVAANISQAVSEPIQVGYNPGGNLDGHAQRAVDTALRNQPGTRRFAAEAVQDVSVAGLPQQVPVHAFRGDASWTGYNVVSGRWFRGPGEADVPRAFLIQTGTSVGDTVTVSYNGARLPVRIVGEVFDLSNKGLTMLTDWPTLASADPGMPAAQYDVQLKAGTGLQSYASALSRALGPDYWVSTQNSSQLIPVITSLVGILSLLIALVAGLGVLNTVILYTRDREHDLGVLKALGMTPGQTTATVVSSVALTGLVTGLAAIPAGIALHRFILPVMAGVAGNGVPAAFLNVYHAPELAALAAAGVLIAVAGSLLPAGRVARSRAAAALRAE